MKTLITIFLALTITASAQTITLHVTEVQRDAPLTLVKAHTQHVAFVLECAEVGNACQPHVGIIQVSLTNSEYVFTADHTAYRILIEKEIQ